MTQHKDSEQSRELEDAEAAAALIQSRNRLVNDANVLVHESLLRLGRRNFWLHTIINIASLSLTLLITIVGLQDTTYISTNQRKVLTGTLGAILATLQTAAASFNLKRKYEGYYSLEVEGRGLLLDIDDAEGKDDLKKCKERLKSLRVNALKLEL
jgi:hypothetical protein